MLNIEKYVDHTLLKADAKKEAIRKICAEAREHGFMSVCVNSCHCELVSKELAGSGVKTCCVVGFPLGAMATEAKAYEALFCVQKGADEVDMVINVGAAKDGDWELVEADIRAGLFMKFNGKLEQIACKHRIIVIGKRAATQERMNSEILRSEHHEPSERVSDLVACHAVF